MSTFSLRCYLIFIYRSSYVYYAHVSVLTYPKKLILYIFWNNAFERFLIKGFVALLNVKLNKARRFFLPILYGFECHMARLAQSKLMRVLENVGLYIIFIGLRWWLFILLGGPWGWSSQAVSSPWVFLVLGCWLVLWVWMEYFDTPKKWIYKPMDHEKSLLLAITLFFITFFFLYPSPFFLVTYQMALSLCL